MRRQIVLLTIVATSIVAMAFVVPLALAVRTLIASQAVDDANREVELVARDLATAEADRYESILANNAALERLALVLPDGAVVGSPVPGVGAESIALARQGRAFSQRVAGGIAVFVPVAREGTDTVVVEALVPDAALQRHLHAIWAVLASLGVGLVGVSAIVAERVARSITAPLNAASTAARSLAQGAMHSRAPEVGTDEVRAVSRSLNELASRIEGLLQEERESLADLSHSLRTPLTALRLEADQIDDPIAQERLRGAVDRLEHAITEVIEQARTPRRSSVTADLSTAVADRLAFWAVLAGAQQRTMTLHVHRGPLPVLASPDDVAAVIDAVVGNVFEHTPAGVGFAVDVEVHAHTARMTVEDGGAGFIGTPTGRGERGRASRGTGLGLDIARRVAERSGGSLSVGRSAGGGALVTVEFGRVRGPVTSTGRRSDRQP